MNTHRQEGYILASATVVMALLALVAAALVLAAAEELRRVTQLEARTIEEARLRSAIMMAASELSLAPAARTVHFDNAQGAIAIDDILIRILVAFESEKVDLDRAPADVIRAQATRFGVAPSDATALLDAVAAHHRHSAGANLLDEILGPALSSNECLHRAFTVFRGRTELAPQETQSGEFVRASPGSRLAITARLGNGRALTAVLLMTGDTDRPARVMDWRWHLMDAEVENIGECVNA